jgi:hypothetical protein
VVREEVRVAMRTKVRAEASRFPGFLHRLNHSKWKTKHREIAGPQV